MKRETLLVGITSFVFGCLVGLVVPKLFTADKVPVKPNNGYTSQGKVKTDGSTDPKVMKQQFEHVLKEYEKIVEKDPKNTGALVTIGNVNFELGKYEKAIDAYQKALDIKPEEGDVWVDMAICYRRLGKTDKAIEKMDKAIEYRPNHSMAHYNKAIILTYDTKNLAEAKKEWEIYLKLEPNSQQKDFVRERLLEIKNKMEQK